jgi:hypothetical protein
MTHIRNILVLALAVWVVSILIQIIRREDIFLTFLITSAILSIPITVIGYFLLVRPLYLE